MRDDMFAADPDIEQLCELLGNYLQPGPGPGSPQAEMLLQVSLRLWASMPEAQPETDWLLRDARILALTQPVDTEMLWARLRDTARRLRDRSVYNRLEDPYRAVSCALDTLSPSRLTQLTGLSETQLERIARGLDSTPNPRLSCVSRCLHHLLGSYTQQGAAQWFGRPRSQLGGRSPAEVLEDAQPDYESLVRLAQGSVG